MTQVIEGIIFDLGNTLIYFDGSWREVAERADAVLVAALKDAGMVLPQEAFKRRFRERLDEYYAQREAEFIEYTTHYTLMNTLAEFGYPEVDDDLLRRVLREMYAISQSHWRPEEDANHTLDRLRQQGYRLGLISNAADDEDVQRLVDKAGLRAYFQPILTSAGEGIRKPNPRIFRKVLNAWGTPPHRVVMVGDTLGADILGAQNAGLYSVWITRRAETPANRAHIETILPDAVIHTLEDLPDLLGRMNSGMK